ncbi:MAG: HNH endonuclease signature motif containing protein [Alphaproteobacteria bacterium]
MDSVKQTALTEVDAEGKAMSLNYQSQNQEQLKLAVWMKGRHIPGYDPAVWRWDYFGAVMKYAEYGSRSSPFGWEVDHIVASAIGGSDRLDNLRPLHWKNNASLGGRL